MIRALLSSRDFLPLFATQFLGALNDNIFKNALVIFVLFTLAPQNAALYATAAAGIFILPFVLFSSLAGFLSDTVDKARIMRAVKAAEIAIMLLAAAAFYLRSAHFLLFVLFLMGTHSAFFGPAKYSILPQHLPPETLVAGNGLLSMGTFVAILSGAIIGTLGIAGENGVEITASICLAVAVAGSLCSFYIPAAPPAPSNANLSPHPLKDIGRMMALTLSGKEIRRCAIAISWFWFLGVTYLTQFPNLAVQVFHADESVVTLFLVMFTLGVAAGSLLCGKLLHDRISTHLAFYAALFLVVFGLDFCVAAKTYAPPGAAAVNIRAFVAQGFLPLRLLFDLFILSVAGGIFYVPLYARVQKLIPLARRARVMAGIGFLNAVFMALSSLMGMVLLGSGFSGIDVIFVSVFMTLAIAFYCRAPEKNA
jgi:acyl-[acyl-carrier-protein]-phospholipid O-acyltransferase/long-chain-fatty-acid--[acyl-carrier-protein] ligase